MDHAIIFVSLIVAVAPLVALLFFIWWVDRYDREPLKYVFAAFLWGGLGAIAFSILGTEAGIRMLGGFMPTIRASTFRPWSWPLSSKSS